MRLNSRIVIPLNSYQSVSTELDQLPRKAIFDSCTFSSRTTSFTNSISVVKTIASILLSAICSSSFDSGNSVFIGQETRSSTFFGQYFYQGLPQPPA